MATGLKLFNVSGPAYATALIDAYIEGKLEIAGTFYATVGHSPADDTQIIDFVNRQLFNDAAPGLNLSLDWRNKFLVNNWKLGSRGFVQIGSTANVNLDVSTYDWFWLGDNGLGGLQTNATINYINTPLGPGSRIVLLIYSTGTFNLTWNANFIGGTTYTLPATTVPNKYLRLEFEQQAGPSSTKFVLINKDSFTG